LWAWSGITGWRFESSSAHRSDGPDVAGLLLWLVEIASEQWPHELLASRVWELRDNLSSYDASYVALAEITGAPLVTLDRQIALAPGLRCAVATP
jgi:predicted nucleic acid-binding protein